jgi:Mrp family chromosome partitioning ATPase
MSSYVDALERWDGEAAGRSAEAAQRDRTTMSAISRVCGRLEGVGAAGHATVVFAGVTGREGAGDVARGCAETFAAEGKRVLLVDLDPAAGDAPGAVALEALLESGRGAEHGPGAGVVTVVAQPRFEGRPRAFEASLHRWLDEQRVAFDRIVVHGGAVLETAAVVPLAAWADATALVVRARWTARGDVVAARERLERAGANLLGAVLVGARPLPRLLERALRLLSLRGM